MGFDQISSKIIVKNYIFVAFWKENSNYLFFFFYNKTLLKNSKKLKLQETIDLVAFQKENSDYQKYSD